MYDAVVVGNGVIFLQVFVKIGQMFQKRKLCNSQKTHRQHNDPTGLGMFRAKCMYIQYEYLYHAVEQPTANLSKYTTSTL